MPGRCADGGGWGLGHRAYSGLQRAAARQVRRRPGRWRPGVRHAWGAASGAEYRAEEPREEHRWPGAWTASVLGAASAVGVPALGGSERLGAPSSGGASSSWGQRALQGGSAPGVSNRSGASSSSLGGKPAAPLTGATLPADLLLSRLLPQPHPASSSRAISSFFFTIPSSPSPSLPPPPRPPSLLYPRRPRLAMPTRPRRLCRLPMSAPFDRRTGPMGRICPMADDAADRPSG